jgi:hypothetical protein
MSLELAIGLVAIFVSGGAVGSAGTLLAQWILRKVDGEATSRGAVDAAEVSALRTEVGELGRHLRNMDARLDFTERLLDGALPLSPPPERMLDTHAPAPSEGPATQRDA